MKPLEGLEEQVELSEHSHTQNPVKSKAACEAATYSQCGPARTAPEGRLSLLPPPPLSKMHAQHPSSFSSPGFSFHIKSYTVVPD